MKAKKSHSHYEGVLSVWWMFPSKFRDGGMVHKFYCLTMLLKPQWVCTMPHSHQINMFNLGPVYTNGKFLKPHIVFTRIDLASTRLSVNPLTESHLLETGLRPRPHDSGWKNMWFKKMSGFVWTRPTTGSVLASEYSRSSLLLAAKHVLRGGTSAIQRQKLHTDDVKSVQNLVAMGFQI